ncbi:AMP-binding protein [Achromobacter anxifer]|uniref:AMP-binding protein n=1 Tax=Achromobacter anxifer TaxID=1287737 RepID=UPI002158998F|nr:AMP-binding protein [Achromobacter anxifer]
MTSMESILPAERLPGVRYPDENRLREYVRQGVLTAETLAGGLRDAFAAHADGLSLVGPDAHYTYRELDERSDRLGAALLALGLRPLDRAIFQCGNSHELLVAFCACLKAGIIPVCSLQAFRKLEIEYLGNLAQARLHLVQGDDPKFDDVAFAREMQQHVPTLEYVLQARGPARAGAATIDALIAATPLEAARVRLAEVSLHPFQVAVFQLSGGTTGVPKIIPRFQSEYLYNMRAVAAWNGYTSDDVLFFPTPYMHNLNMGCFFGPFLLSGAQVTVCRSLDEATLQSLVRTYRPTWFGVAGPILTRILPELSRADAGEKARRRFITPRNAAGLARTTGSPAFHIFGMTEGVIMFAREGDKASVLESSVGRPVSVHDEVRIVAPGTDAEVPVGEIGEALFRGPYTIRGYYRSEAEDVGRFTPDGFYRSGDLMRCEVHEGRRYFYFCGRIKDVVDRGGEKINAEEVENVLNGHPGILTSAVVAMPDPVYGERVCAFVIARKEGAALTLPAVCGYLQEVGLAKFKWPERLEVVDEFPLSASGKLSKKALRSQIAATLEAERGLHMNGEQAK